jgi:hypothetical protein
MGVSNTKLWPMFVKSIKFCSMLSALLTFHVSGLLGFRRPLLRHRAMRGFIADTRRSPSGLGHRSIKTTELCTGVRPSTSKQSRVLWIVLMMQQHLRMTVSNLAHSQYIRNRSREWRIYGCYASP